MNSFEAAQSKHDSKYIIREDYDPLEDFLRDKEIMRAVYTLKDKGVTPDMFEILIKET